MRKIIITWLALCVALFGAWQLSALDIPHFKLVTPAHAQLSMTGAGAGAPGGGAPPITSNVVYTGSQAITGSNPQTTFSFSSLPSWGTCTRTIVAVASFSPSGGSTAVSSMTIAGTAATLISSHGSTLSQNANGDTEIWESNSATATSGTVSVTFASALTGAFSGAYVAVYCLTTTTTAASDAENNSTTGATSLSENLNVTDSAGGCIAIYQTVSGGGLTISFGSNITLDNNNNTNSSIDVGHCDTYSASPLTITNTTESGTLQGTLSLSAWVH
jgi:hypothetical protein